MTWSKENDSYSFPRILCDVWKLKWDSREKVKYTRIVVKIVGKGDTFNLAFSCSSWPWPNVKPNFSLCMGNYSAISQCWIQGLNTGAERVVKIHRQPALSPATLMFLPPVTWETHIPTDMCSLAWETHIPSDMCSLPGKHISLVICVPPPGESISLVICVTPPRKHISQVICVPPPGKRISLVICVPHLGNTYL